MFDLEYPLKLLREMKLLRKVPNGKWKTFIWMSTICQAQVPFIYCLTYSISLQLEMNYYFNINFMDRKLKMKEVKVLTQDLWLISKISLFQPLPDWSDSLKEVSKEKWVKPNSGRFGFSKSKAKVLNENALRNNTDKHKWVKEASKKL